MGPTLLESVTNHFMTIDDTQTPVSEETAHQPAEAGEAPAKLEQTETPATAAIDAEHDAPTETHADVEPEPTPVAETAPEPRPESAPEVAATHETEPEPAPAPAEPPTPVAPAPAAAAPVAVSSDADLFDSYMNMLDGGEGSDGDVSYKKLTKGERLEATIIQVDRDRVFVDLGTKSEGIIPLGELSEENIDSATDHFNVGDKINVVVIRPEGAEGNPIVSKRRADFEEVWDRIEDAFKSSELLTAQVVDRVKGGLVVDVGVRGFVPATHVGSGKLRNIEKYVGQPLQLKVIEIDRERKKVVLSNRQAEEERRATAKEDIFSNVHPGDVLEGTVRRLADYGAFVDLGGVDGLLHISEMSWMRITHPREMFKEGQKIKVMVLRLDPGAGKISLGHRQVLPDPWNLIKEHYTVGQKLTVTIGRLVQSGAFIKLPEGAEAFMPISEMSFRRIRRPDEAVEENQEIEAQIIDLRPDERRMVLSLRAIGSTGVPGGRPMGPSAPRENGFDDESRGKGLKGKKGAKKGRGGRDDFDDFEDVAGRRGYATGGATIGERLGMLKGFLGRDEDEDADETGESHEAQEAHGEGEPATEEKSPKPKPKPEAQAETEAEAEVKPDDA
jgi:4-hydroxy-3-methylbut-2-enyl diphosphate reductase